MYDGDMKRRIDPATGIAIIKKYAAEEELSVSEQRTAARFALEEFAERHPGRSVEIRIPWAGAVQAIAGPVHTRGTPPNVVEMDTDTWLALAVGKPTNGIVRASGSRSDLTQYLPLFGPAQLEN